MLDRLLKRLGEILSDDHQRGVFLRKAKGCLRLPLFFGVFGYTLGLLLLIPLFQWPGENNLTLAFLLYVPRQLFLLPLPLIVLLALIVNWRLPALPLIAATVFVLLGMEYEVRTPPANLHRDEHTLTVLTYNRGQHRNQSLQPFKNAMSPDIIAFQEARNRARRYGNAESYSEFSHVDGVGEFTVLSRHPIVASRALEFQVGEKVQSPAARFEIETPMGLVALYSVHFTTPRDTLLYYRNGAFLYGVIGLPGTPWAAKRKRNQRFWDYRIELARVFSEMVENDPLPVIVAGDFNAPSGGYIHGIFLTHLEDSHLEAGSGFGFTFPGITRNPLSLGGPWMRIDYLLAEKNEWDTVWSIAEADRPSQHRAVAAQFRLKSAVTNR